MQYFFLILISFLFFSSPSKSQEHAYISKTWENDRWADTDRHYTNGNIISYLSKPDDFNDWWQLYIDHLPFTEDQTQKRWSVTYGQNMFTPEDISSRELQTNDRPYAAWMYLDLGLQVHKKDEYVDKHSFNIGIVGPSAQGEAVQTWVHKVTDSPTPYGWDNQLNDEIALMYSFDRSWIKIYDTSNSYFDLDITPNGGFSIGNVFTQLHSGLTMRIGSDLSGIYDIPNRINPAMSGKSAFEYRENLEGYAFAGINTRRVFHNIFLDGNTFSQSHSVDREPWVWDFQLGGVMMYEGIRFSYTHVFSKEEFKQQIGDTQFGVLSISFAF